MAKRVLIFSLTYDPFIGGAEVAIKEITDRLRFENIFFDMITLRFDATLPEREKVGNITVHRVGFTREEVAIKDIYAFPLSLNKYLFPFLAYRKARKLHAKHFYDCLWSIQANYAGFAALFTKKALSHVPFLLTLQEGDPPEHYRKRVGLLAPLHTQIFQRADMVQAISHFLGAYARSMGHAGPVEVIPNGVDVKRFAEKPSEKEINALAGRLKKHTKEKYIITTSRLVKKNAIDDIIRALIHMPPSVKLLVLGEGPEGQWLWQLAGKHGVADRVLFTGNVPQDKIPLYLAVSDVFVRPSRSEGMGISFIEAMAAGIPVVATPVGGIVDFLYDPEKTKLGQVTPTGLFCEVDNPKSIADAVMRLFEDDELRKNIIVNASEMVAGNYEWDIVARKMRKNVFNKIFASH